MSDNQAPRSTKAVEHRLKRMRDRGLKPEHQEDLSENQRNRIVNCGWGRLIFGNTFETTDDLVEVLRDERPDRRDIALYVWDPHVVVGTAPQELFLDPSHTYRLELSTYRPAKDARPGFTVRRLSSRSDAEAINTLYESRGMVPVPLDFFWSELDPRMITVLVAEEDETGAIIGTAMGVDHDKATNGADQGSSLWCLSVSPQARFPGVGEAMVRRLAEIFMARGLAHLDLSVLHDNPQAIALYEKLGFERVPYFTVKRKNMINEALFAGPAVEEGLNPYATIIVNEARRRGIQADVMDASAGLFRLSYGGRSVTCRESLSEFTSAVAMSICDDKTTTRRIVEAAGICVPDQISADDGDIDTFLAKHKSVVVKPARGEQGKGIAIGLKSRDEIDTAVTVAKTVSSDVLIEQQIIGQDLRLVVIDYKVVAAAIRRPAEIIGDGQKTIRELIDIQSRRRSKATGGESKILVDDEAQHCLEDAGYGLDDVPAEGQTLPVRRTANLHTGGTIHDVTGQTHHTLIEAAIRAAKAINIPVTGIDFMVQNPCEPDYMFIEANERPGLANHEPQPTAERFIDFLFPLSLPQSVRETVRDTLTKDPS